MHGASEGQPSLRLVYFLLRDRVQALSDVLEKERGVRSGLGELKEVYR